MMRLSHVTLAAAIAFAGLTSAANAGTITFSGSVPQTTTNFSTAVGFSKFDPALGTLTSIVFNLAGTVTGSARAESLDGGPSTVTEVLASTIQLQRPDATSLVVVLPSTTVIDSFTAFDGVFDFGGTSGATHPGLSATASNSATSTSASDFTLFTGTAGTPGSISLLFAATGASSGTGAGNLITQFGTQALANANVTYNYTDAPQVGVPEPASMALLGAGLLGVGLIRRKRA